MANSLANFVPQIWSTNIVANLDQLNVAYNVMCNIDYQGEIQEKGDTVQVRTFGSVNMQNYTRGNPISYEDLNPSKETLTVTDSKLFAFEVDDLDRAQNDINALDGYSKRAAVALANEIDRKALSFYASANSANQLTNGGSAWTVSAANAYTLLVDAGAKLDALSVPAQDRWVIISPIYKAFLLKDITYLIRASDLGDSVITTARVGMTANTAPGFFGRIAGFDLYVSPALPVDASGKYCQYGQGKPVSYARQLVETEALRLESTMATAVRGLLLHGAAVFAEDAKRFGTIYVGATQ
jgi:hypothetical protein